MLAALLLAAATAAAFPAAGTYAYGAAMSGQPVGRWAVTVAREPGEIELQEDSNASVYGIALAAQATLVLGEDLAPLRYEGHYRTPEQSIATEVTLGAQTATATSSLAAGAQSLALAPGTRHYVVVEPGLLAGLFALPAQLAAWKDAALTWIAPASGRATLLTLGAAAASRPAGVPAGDAVVAIDQPIAVTIWYDPATLVPDRIDVPSQNAVLTRER